MPTDASRNERTCFQNGEADGTIRMQAAVLNFRFSCQGDDDVDGDGDGQER